jgi:histone deacetylase 6
MTSQGDSVYFNRETFNSAKLAAGGAIETAGHVVEGKVRNAFAIVRPPGHHAEPTCSMGFCHFNNVSVAARAIMKQNSSIKKVMILDWDVHHGMEVEAWLCRVLTTQTRKWNSNGILR